MATEWATHTGARSRKARLELELGRACDKLAGVAAGGVAQRYQGAYTAERRAQDVQMLHTLQRELRESYGEEVELPADLPPLVPPGELPPPPRGPPPPSMSAMPAVCEGDEGDEGDRPSAAGLPHPEQGEPEALPLGASTTAGALMV